MWSAKLKFSSFKRLIVQDTYSVGRQDAMHRQSLIPIGEFVRESFAKDGAGLELLDVATGTGRHATFIKVSRFAFVLWVL